MYVLEPTTKYRRDVKRLKKQDKDLEKLQKAHDLLQQTGALPKEYAPHPLRGDYVGCIDAHIKPDWVIIYEVFEDDQAVVLRRTGSHQELFKNY